MSLDVVMCTWNSNRPYFRNVLKSIKQEIPIHCFILIDKFSTDRTCHTVRTHFPNARIILSEGLLGRARKLGIQYVDTEYFAFIDDDIILPKGWFEKLQNHIDSETGAIHGYAIPAVNLPYEEKWRKWQEKWAESKLRERILKEKPSRLLKIIEVTKENRNKFLGYTHNTIIKLDACKDWKPCANLSVFEDQILLWHIVSKGYKWKIVREIIVPHYTYGNLTEHLEKVKWRTAGERMIGLSNYSRKELLMIGFLKRFFIGCKTSIDVRDPRILPYVFFLYFAFLEGYLQWNKHMILERKATNFEEYYATS